MKKMGLKDKIKLFKRLAKELSNLVVYDFDKEMELIQLKTENKKWKSWEFVHKHRIVETRNCKHCKKEIIIEKFNKIPIREIKKWKDYIYYTPKLFYYCPFCKKFLGETCWYSSRYPVSTTTTENTIRMSHYKVHKCE